MDSYPNFQRPPYEQKAHYDELVDDFSAPRHQTYSAHPFHSLPNRPVKMSEDTSHEDLNPIYPPLSSKGIEQPPPNLWTRIVPDSLACKLFVLVVLVETAIDLAIEGDLLIRLNGSTDTEFENLTSAQRKMPVYLALFALAHIFNAAFLLYSIIQITEIRDDTTLKIPITALTTIIPIVISIAEIAYIALGWKIYNEFGWKVYKFLGADRRVKKMYANYQIFLCLVKFDVFFWAAFSVQFIWLVLKKDDWEYYVTCAALPLSIILLVEGHLAARHENKWMMAVFMSGCVAAMVYFIYKLARVLIDIKTDLFKFIWKSLTVFSILAILLLVATFVLSILVLKNFGYGLKDALARKDAQEHRRDPSQAPHRRHASTHLNRMSID
ncbi:hypothetical protein DL96DRAFT_1574132 [Flagelloscypha sp. PMI_526]|nr:hypothetical protein DL96DRAFT_1574132 [Flagelloscypha sp. PMI_526]